MLSYAQWDVQYSMKAVNALIHYRKNFNKFKECFVLNPVN